METTAIITAAQAEAARMQAALGEMTEGNVQMSVEQFGRLATLIAALVEVATETGSAQTREAGAPGDPAYWVPLAHFARTKARCDALERLASVGALGLAA